MQALALVATVSDMLGWGDVTDIDLEDTSIRKIMRHANLVLKSMQSERNWKELDTTGTILTQDLLSDTGTVVAAYGVTRVVITGFDATPYIGAMISFNEQKEWYRIVDADSSTAVIIDRPYIGEALTSDNDYTIARDTYQLPDNYDRMTSKRMYCRTKESYVDLVDDTELDYAREVGITTNFPTKFVIRGLTPQGKNTLVFDFLPDDAYSFAFSYQKEHHSLKVNTDEILYPNRYSLAIVDQIVSRLNRGVEDQQKSMADAQAALSEKVKQGANPDSGERRARITPWTGRARRRQ